MSELNDLLRPSWGAEKWISEGWQKITTEEKELIKHRLDELFKEGLPFELKHDKLLYIYVFSLLAQFEVLAIQVPLRFEAEMPTPLFKQQMRAQLLDEIFHGMVFTKILYLLCDPYTSPPAYSDHIETFCNFVRNEACPKVGVVLLNLVAESWIEEVFKCMHQNGIATDVFQVILEDEHRHVCEADLYHAIGLPDTATLRAKLEILEEMLLVTLALQPKYMMAMTGLLGAPAIQRLTQSLHEKHTSQLKKIKLVPSERWQLLMKANEAFFKNRQLDPEHHFEVAMTPIRRTFMTQWGSPGDPNMVGQFNLDISCLEFFSRKNPNETLTALMMQAVSQVLAENDRFRTFIRHKKLYQSKYAYVSVVVKLPDCGDHLGTIVFKNCHTLSVQELSKKIRQVVQAMTVCYKMRAKMDEEFPHLKHKLDSMLYDWAHDTYPYPTPGSSTISVSNVGYCGYSQTVSPLRKQESMKISLLKVDRQPVWSHSSQSFEPKDLLPISISADHRLFDGNIPVPGLLKYGFHMAFERMSPEEEDVKHEDGILNARFSKLADEFLEKNTELGYRILVALQTLWPEFLDLNNPLADIATQWSVEGYKESLLDSLL